MMFNFLGICNATNEIITTDDLSWDDIDEIREIDELSAGTVWDVDEWKTNIAADDRLVCGVFVQHRLSGVVVYEAFPLIGAKIEKLIIHPSANRKMLLSVLIGEIEKLFQIEGFQKSIVFKSHAIDEEFEGLRKLFVSVGFRVVEQCEHDSFVVFQK